jgi:hypothetical protein
VAPLVRDEEPIETAEGGNKRAMTLVAGQRG